MCKFGGICLRTVENSKLTLTIIFNSSKSFTIFPGESITP